MATGGHSNVGCTILNIGTLTLETADIDPYGIAVSGDLLVIIDYKVDNVHLYRRHDGKLLAVTDKLESRPRGICIFNDTDICVALSNGTIYIMSVLYTKDIGVIKIHRKLNVNTTFDECHGVVKMMDNVAVCGRTQNRTMCWCIVSIKDGHVDKMNKMFKGYRSYLTAKDNMIYISCDAGRVDSPEDTGVYGYNIQIPGKESFRYKHKELDFPTGITVDPQGFLFVCNFHPSCIHHLNDKCELVNIYREEIPRYLYDILWDHGLLFVTSKMSNVITQYKPQYSRQGHYEALQDERKRAVVEKISTAANQGIETEKLIYEKGFETEQVLPPEILNMDDRFQKLYKEVLATGKEKVYNIRVMIVGNQGVGKTSLTQRLLGFQVKENDTESTEGIEVHSRCCQIDHATGEWKRKLKTDELVLNDQRIASILHKYASFQNNQDMNETDAADGISPTKRQRLDLHSEETVPSPLDGGPDSLFNEAEASQTSTEARHCSESKGDVTLDITEQTGNGQNESKRAYPEEIKNFLERAQSLPFPLSKSSDISLLDFAGQSLFYTTHQVFMSWRTLYLLVTDMSLPLTDAVEEGEYRIDLSGRKACNIHEYVTYWLNSVHSHALIPEDYRMRREENKTGSEESSGDQTTRKHPFVILVGTHSDKIPKELLDQRKTSYFNDIRIVLKNSPLMLHLADEDFAISNLGSDPNINVLKSKIFDIAQKQMYWGEEIPARWIPLERALIELKNRGIQVMAYTDVKSINEKLQVRIELPEEFDLFLRFEHDMGNIIFFNTERLKKNVVLDPEWLIHGVRIWITSDRVIKKHPELTEQWFAFKDTGRLTGTLIEKLWSSHSEIYQHKQHLLDVMEELSIIAKPLEKEEEDYYWVPCMVSLSAPEEVKKLQQNKDTTRTSTLCFRSKTNFIHVGVFHRLLATCLSKWTPAKEGNIYLLFRGLCVFNLDAQHQLFISLNDFVIHATVTRFTKRARIPDLSRCMAIRDELYTALSEISDCLCPGSELEICIKCKESSPLTNEGLHSVSTLRINDELGCSTHKEAHCVDSMELLGFWEEDKKQIPASVFPQHSTLPSERFTRISSLVLDVGSQVLRELLTCCTTASNCTLDQYMKANEPQILQLQKRKVLTQDQLDIILPPSGQTDINKYDITLASALLNNIYPLLGQQEKQLITDLRTQRNELAHSHSTKMSEQEFLIKWTKVQTILTDLCKLCKNPSVDSKVQKEIQDIQKSGSCAIISKVTTIREELKKVSQLLEEIETT